MIRSSNRKKIRHCNFMQAFLAAAHDPKAAVVLHNTRACSNIALTAYRSLRERPTEMAKSKEGGDNLFSTALDDRDAIFGGEEKLAACLTDICAVRRPDYILVACGCVPGVTGDDAAAVCRAVREKTGVPILLLPGQGFMVPEGIDMTLAAADLLFEEFTYPRRGDVSPVSDTVVLVGSGAYYIEAPIFAELRAFFDVFGITRLYTPPGGMTKADYEALPAARVAAALSMGVVKKDASAALAEKFAARLHMPLLNLNEIDSPEELTARLRVGGKAHGADMVLADSQVLRQAAQEGAFVPYLSERADSVLDAFKAEDGAWIGVWYDPVVFCVNSDYLRTLTRIPQTWEELALYPDVRIGMTDFLAADAAANLYLSLVATYGDSVAVRLMVALHPKVVQYVKFLSTPVRMAGMGEVDVALAVQSETLRYMNNGYPLRIIYPTDGTAYMLTGAAMLRDDYEPAATFADWLLSDEAQLALQGAGVFFVPTNPGTLTYQMLAGKNIALFPAPPIYTPAERRALLDRWLREVRFK